MRCNGSQAHRKAADPPRNGRPQTTRPDFCHSKGLAPHRHHITDPRLPHAIHSPGSPTWKPCRAETQPHTAAQCRSARCFPHGSETSSAVCSLRLHVPPHRLPVPHIPGTGFRSIPPKGPPPGCLPLLSSQSGPPVPRPLPGTVPEGSWPPPSSRLLCSPGFLHGPVQGALRRLPPVLSALFSYRFHSPFN